MIKIDTDRLNQNREEVVTHMNIVRSLNQEIVDMWDKLEDDFNENLTTLQEQYPILNEVTVIQNVMVGNSGKLQIKFKPTADVTAANLTGIEELTGLKLSHLTRRNDEILAIFKLY